jgi:ribonucleoside-diphosphate reductase alpha chain
MVGTRLGLDRHFTTPGVHPFDEVEWTLREARIAEPGRDGVPERVIFEQSGCEFPAAWSDQAVRIVAARYFRYGKDDPRRERSLRQVIDRVVDTIRYHGQKGGYFAGAGEAETFAQELRHLLLHQKASFNSPVWFNTGVEVARRTHDPERMLQVDLPPVEPHEPSVGQASACFILSCDDDMGSIQEWIATESEIFRGGSGAGVNLSRLRADGEPLSNGGQASGPVSFMRWADSGAGSIKSGGGTRRAAKMVILNGDHPDVLEFIRCKADEEKKAYALGDAGYDMSLNGEAWRSIQFQNANNSVRLTDDFFRRVERDEPWELRYVSAGGVARTLPAREVLREIAEATWMCGDPGLQYEDTIQRWHTNPVAGPITASNPCSEFMSLDNSACNLASLNLMRFLDDDGRLLVDDVRHAVRVMITAQDIIVDPAAYPTRKIGRGARSYRQLGLGYANLGALLMSLGLPYDSDEGRGWAGAITALMQGEAYAQSARLADRLGPYQGYPQDKEAQDRVVRMHRDALTGVPEHGARGNYAEVRDAAVSALEDAVQLGQGRNGSSPGYRNAQVSVLAPTGTISLMMDCDTTGLEPSAGLITYKTLVGGGFLRLVNGTVERGLAALGYAPEERAAVMAHVDVHETVEGAPGLRPEHLPVFDCAFNAPGHERAIAPEGHVRMMGAVQPFISGAISKTCNLPEQATVQDIERIYVLGWSLGLKAIAVYRNNSKRVQPLRTGEAREGAAETAAVAAPIRRRLPDDRDAKTHKFSIGGQEGYITVGLYEDGSPGEVFVKMSKQGSTVSGLMDSVAISWSMALQHGVPVESLVSKYIDMRFEPAGYTSNPKLPMARSVVDYLARWMALQFLPEEDQVSAGVLVKNQLVLPVGGEVMAPRADDPPVQADGAAGEPPRLRLAASGQTCTSCGSANLVRSGTCFTCRDCGATSGCG